MQLFLAVHYWLFCLFFIWKHYLLLAKIYCHISHVKPWLENLWDKIFAVCMYLCVLFCVLDFHPLLLRVCFHPAVFMASTMFRADCRPTSNSDTNTSSDKTTVHKNTDKLKQQPRIRNEETSDSKAAMQKDSGRQKPRRQKSHAENSDLKKTATQNCDA